VSARLSPAREARLKLAIFDAFAARGGDPAEFRRRLGDVVDLGERLYAEQLAEQGFVPETIAGCVAVLYVAARIIDLIEGDDDAMA
jgi:hypothetical protein